MKKKNSKLLYWLSNFGVVIVTLTCCYSILGLLCFFNVIDPNKVKNITGFIIFLLIGICCGLGKIIYNLSSQLSKTDVDSTNKEESLSSMVKQAYEDKRFREVIKIGTAVSDLLWYSGRKDLRIRIGSYVEKAARKTDDNYALARVYIEDIGNTYIEMPKDNSIEKAITNIKQGIAIANANKYHYLSARGYRNLACAYTFKFHKERPQKDSDLTEANTAIRKGRSHLQYINNPYELIDAKASLEYAQCRIYQNNGANTQALNCLRTAKKLYEDMSNYPEKSSVAKDRLKKIYRELGEHLLASNDEADIKNGEELILRAFDTAEGDRDYTNMIRSAEVYIRHMKDYGIERIKPIMDTCDSVIKYLPEDDIFRKSYEDLIKSIK